MARTVVTGGAGFIGSHLTEHLLSVGDSVVVIDDFSTGRKSNLRAVEDDPNLTVVVGSVADHDVVRQAIEGADEVYHLAATVGVRQVLDDPLRGFANNLSGTENLLRASTRSGASVLIASSSEVYGKNASGTVSESSASVFGSPSVSRWSYGISKWADEFLGRQYYEVEQSPVVSVRLFNIIGPRQVDEYGMVVPRFIRQASEGRPITVYGDGTQRRAFCSVHDVAPALVALLRNVDSHGLSVNLGSSTSVTVLELATAVLEVTGSDSDVDFIQYEEAYRSGFEDYSRALPDLSLARRLIDFRPRVTLTTALTELWELCRERGVS